MATAHIAAERGDFVKTVLMPDGPLRAKFLANTFIDNARCITSVGNMYGYTGTYQANDIQ